MFVRSISVAFLSSFLAFKKASGFPALSKTECKMYSTLVLVLNDVKSDVIRGKCMLGPVERNIVIIASHRISDICRRVIVTVSKAGIVSFIVHIGTQEETLIFIRECSPKPLFYVRYYFQKFCSGLFWCSTTFLFPQGDPKWPLKLGIHTRKGGCVSIVQLYTCWPWGVYILNGCCES